MRAANVQIRTGQRWKAQAEVTKAISRLQHKEIIGRVQARRAGLGYDESPKSPCMAQDCSMRADLGRRLQFPREITSTSLQPDIVLWSSTTKLVLLIELTIQWEAGVEAAWEPKRLKYSDLAEECRKAGWRTTIYLVEVGCCGFVGTSAVHLLREMGVCGASLQKASKDLADEAEKSSFWLWLKRRDTSWGTI